MTAPTDKPAYAVWFMAGVLQVLVFQAIAVFGSGEGNWAWLLQVASEKPFKHRVQAELGPVPNQQPLGHDGEMLYLIARDPLGRKGVPELMLQCDNPEYRYRRILFPLLAGGLGQFGPWLTVSAMSFWIAIGNGLAIVALADLVRYWRLERWSILLAWINPGVLMSAGCMTMDTLALGLVLAGVALWLRERWGWSIAMFVLSALTKEVLLLVPWGLAFWCVGERRHRRALMLAVVPAAAVGAWSLWLRWTLPTGLMPVNNFSLPFVGIFEGARHWSIDGQANDAAWMLGTWAIGSVVAASALVVVSSNRLLIWLSLPWIMLGIIASDAIWGSNAVRVLLPLWPLTALHLGWVLRARSIADHAGQAEASA